MENEKEIKAVNFEYFADVVAMLKEFCAYFEMLPVKVDGKMELVSWGCGLCSHYVLQAAEGAERDCTGKGWSDEECIAKFYPKWIRHDWFDKLFPKYK